MPKMEAAKRWFGAISSWTDIVLRGDSFINPLTHLGNPDFDKGAAATPTTRLVSSLEARDLYRFNGIAKRLVDIVPDMATSKGWRIDIAQEEEDEAGDSDDAVDLDPLHGEDTRLNVWDKVSQAWKWGRRDGGGYLLMVTDIEDEDMSDPLPEGATIVVLQDFTCVEMSPLEYEDDIKLKSFRCPKTFMLTPATGGNAGEVHGSRVLYFAGALLDPFERFQNRGIDASIYESTIDQIRNVTTIGQSGANLAQELRIHVVKTSVPDELDSSSGMLFFQERMKLLARQKSAVGLVVIGEDEEYVTQNANVSGFQELAATARDELAAVIGLPQTRLFGQAPGGLNTDGASQRQATNDLISMAQDTFLKASLRKLYTVLMAQPEVNLSPEEWAIVYHPSSELTAPEQADLEKTHAETDKVRIETGVVTPEHVAESRFSDAGYQNQLGAVDPEDLVGPTTEEMARAVEEGQAPPEALEEAPEQAEDTEPDTDPAEAGETPEAPTATAYNGAQMAQASLIVKDVTAGLLARAGAKNMLQTLLNLTPEAAEGFLIGAEEAEKPAPTVAFGGPAADEANEPEANEPEANEPEANEPEANEPEANEPEANEPDDA